MAETHADNVALDEDEALGDMLVASQILLHKIIAHILHSNDEESTASVRSSVFGYPVEHGRRYHAFKSGTYHRPNDEVLYNCACVISIMLIV